MFIGNEYKFVKNGKYRNINTGRYYYIGYNCLNCGKNEYLSTKKDSKFCSPECVKDHNRIIIYNNLKNSFIKEGYDLLTGIDEYVNQNTKLEFICPNGHRHKIRTGNWKIGQRCGKCSKNYKVEWSQVIDLFEVKKGWKVLTKEEEWNSSYKDKIRFKCSKGHIHKYTYTSLKNKDHYGCPYCSNMVKIEFSDIIKSFKSEGWKVYTKKNEYRSQNSTKIDCECPNGHRQLKSVRKWRMGRRCEKCVTSGFELDVRKYLNNVSSDYNFFYNVRNVIDGELDIYLPSIRKSIECNGDYWHCNPLFYDENYFHKHKKMFAYEIWNKDKKKVNNCNESDIDLLVLWEHDWKYNNKHIKMVLNEFFEV